MFRHLFDAFTYDFFQGVDLSGNDCISFANLLFLNVIISIGSLIVGSAVVAALQPVDGKMMRLWDEYQALTLLYVFLSIMSL